MTAPHHLFSRRLCLGAIPAAVVVLEMFFAGLGSIPLTSPNEGLYAEVAREMLEGRDPILPRADGVVYLEKPPLLYWLMAASLRLLGPNAFAARLPSALAAAATAWLLFAAGRRLFGGAAGAVSAIVFATGLGFAIMARQVMFDALLTLWITAALLAFWFGTSPSAGASRRRWLLAGYAALGLGILTKGLLGVVLPLLVAACYAIAARDFRRLRAAWSAPGLLVLLAIALPWHIAAAVRQKEFAWFYIVNEHWLRFLGRRRPPDFHQDPIYAPLAALLLLVYPWSVLLPAAFRSALRPQRGRERRPEALFLAAWILTPVVFFTLSRTRTYYYLLPVVPPLALLLGMFWAKLRGAGRRGLRSPWVLAPAGVIMALAAAAWIGCGVFRGRGSRGAAFQAVAFAGGFWLVLGLCAAFLFARKERRGGVFASLAAGTALALPTAIGFVVNFRPEAFVHEEPAAALVRSYLPADDTVIAMEGKFENHSSFAFYIPRRLFPILAVEGHGGGDLEFGGHLPGAPRSYVSNAELFEIAARRPLFYLTKTPSRLTVPDSVRVLVSDDRATLWTNCVPPSVPHPARNKP